MIKFSVENKLSSLEAAKEYFNFKHYLILSTLSSPVMGLITSLIVALFTKKS